MLCYLNGKLVDKTAAVVGVEDRGFVFGDGVYEVWRVVSGRLFEMERHLERLVFGLRELRIAAPDIVRADVLTDIADQVLASGGLQEGEATLYLEITRGVAPRAHAFPPVATSPTVFMMANRFVPPNEVRARGAAAITVEDVRWLRCDLKTIQLLPNVLAKQAATERGAMEAIMVRDGVVTEGSHANVIGVLDGVIRTHPTTNLILPGVTRAVVLEIARRLAIPVSETAFHERDLPRLDELFLVGTTGDVMPIVRLNDQPVASGSPGPVARQLYSEFRAHIDACCGVARVA
jgi:D-alanine transaminase